MDIDVLDKITDYLSSGGLFNPELMEHDKVRDMVIEAREVINQLCFKVEELQNDVEWRSEATRLIKNLNVANKTFDQKEYVTTLNYLFALADAGIDKAKE